MPQPIRGELRNINFDSELLAQRHHLCVLLAGTLNEWSKGEGALGVLLGAILKIPIAAATQTLGSVVNFTARLEVVKAAASATLPAAHSMEIHALMEFARKKAIERNDLAHGIWGISTQYPDRLILCGPKDAYLVAARHVEDDLSPKEILASFQPYLSLWSESCFREKRDRFAELQTSIIKAAEVAVNR